MSPLEVFVGRTTPPRLVRNTIEHLGISANQVIFDPKDMQSKGRQLIMGGDGSLNLLLTNLLSRELFPDELIILPFGTSNVTHRGLMHSYGGVEINSTRIHHTTGHPIHSLEMDGQLFTTDACFGTGPEFLGFGTKLWGDMGLRGRPRPPLSALLSTTALMIASAHNQIPKAERYPIIPEFTIASASTHFGRTLVDPKLNLEESTTFNKFTLKEQNGWPAWCQLANAYLRLGLGHRFDEFFSRETVDSMTIQVPSKQALLAGDLVKVQEEVTIQRSFSSLNLLAGVLPSQTFLQKIRGWQF